MRKKPEFAMANVVVVKMGSGNVNGAGLKDCYNLLMCYLIPYKI